MKVTIESPLQSGETFEGLAQSLQLQHSNLMASPGFAELSDIERFQVTQDYQRVITILYRLDKAISLSSSSEADYSPQAQ